VGTVQVGQARGVNIEQKASGQQGRDKKAHARSKVARQRTQMAKPRVADTHRIESV
jgi:hypothetical protein